MSHSVQAQNKQISITVRMSPEEFAAVTARTKAAIAHGTISYVDAFDFQRFTRFALAHDGPFTESKKKLSIMTERNDAV
jgi:hypothetical protein